MIASFADETTRRLAERGYVRHLPTDVQRRALRKMRLLESIDVLSQLGNVPGNALERLRAIATGNTASASMTNGGYALHGWRVPRMPSKSSITIDREGDRMPPVHPGEILREEFLSPLGMTPGELAGALHLPASTIDAVVSERADVTADLAMRLGRYFGTPADMWLRLQVKYELDVAHDAAGDRIEREVQPRVAAG